MEIKLKDLLEAVPPPQPLQLLCIAALLVLSATAYFMRRFIALASSMVSEDQPKRKHDDFADEKPKRKHDDLELGDDGELIDTIDTTGMSLDDLLQQYDRMDDE